MKRAKKPVEYPETTEETLAIKEAAALYGIKRDVLGVREAKDQLSRLIQRAADGEEIVITSDGVPAAMIVPYRPAVIGKPYRPNWAHLRSMPQTSKTTEGIRAERDAGA